MASLRLMHSSFFCHYPAATSFHYILENGASCLE